MVARDYYDILEILRNASEAQIKQAHRNLVRKYHPDVSKDKNADQKFKELQQAYEVLSDKKKRAAYDQFGHAGVGMGAGAAGSPGSGWPFGSGGAKVYDWTGTNPGGGVDFGLKDVFGDIFGSAGSPFGKRSRRQRRPVSIRGKDVENHVTLAFEQAIWGTKLTIQIRGTDKIGKMRANTIEVKIPPGVSEGSKIRIRGKGEQGVEGGRPGDLYIITHVKPHQYFDRKGNDIYIDLPITVEEAIRGAKVTIPTIDGPTVVAVPPGTSSGQKLRLREKGAPEPKTSKRGNQYAVIKIVVPQKITSEVDQLLEKLKDACKDPRKKLGWVI